MLIHKCVYIFIFFLTLQVDILHGLSCPLCNRRECPKPCCEGGLVKDACNCCDVCAKLKGERCGGPFGGHECDTGLHCQRKEPYGDGAVNSAGFCAEPGLKCAFGAADSYTVKDCNSTENICYNASVTDTSINSTSFKGCGIAKKNCDICKTNSDFIGKNCTATCCGFNMCNRNTTTTPIPTVTPARCNNGSLITQSLNNTLPWAYLILFCIYAIRIKDN
ncbi:cysteine-rich motor neuron 1 protein-like [Hydractinia symbiolongicarpus]|uniref:cysteine-rich motor neuron 1 protein-like n=1 Tax=Hydractinia symbiolongicarpus TaxID=13093 RepID=UPI00254C587B|nr:cysteine-rich motor neuron 1 protein-like [Hydractinia symbiolongicarpus]